MIEKDDWRLSFGQERYMVGAVMKYVNPYQKASEEWEHEHCEFCTIKISEYDGDLHEAYATLDEKCWVCPECFKDFKEMFHWTLQEAQSE